MCDINPACGQFIATGDKLAALSLGITLATNFEGSEPSPKATSRDFTRLIIEGRLADKQSVFRAPLPV